MLFGEGPQIKNIAADLNKLFRQGSLLNQSSQTVEGDAAADQGTADLLAAMDPVIQEVAVGISGEESRYYTVSGTPPLTLTDSLGMPLSSWSVELSPYQEGTGDPSPSNVRPIHGTDKLNLFVEESYDQSATPKAVITLPYTIYDGTISNEGGLRRWLSYTITNVGSVGVSTLGVKYAQCGVLGSAKYDGGIMCESYKPSNNAGTDNSIRLIGNSLYVYDNRFTDLETAQSLLIGVKLIYELATPIPFSLTTPDILTSRGNASAWATAEDGTVESMSVTYVGKA